MLRIFIGEIGQVDHKPLFQVLVLKARELGPAGATVLRGIESFGAKSRVIHTAKILRLSEDLPIIVEIDQFHRWQQVIIRRVALWLGKIIGMD